MRSQSGQTSAEYLGGLLLVSVVVALVALTPLGGEIAWHAKILVCEIGGGTGCGSVKGNPQEPDASQCIVHSSDRAIDASVKVLVFKFSGGVSGVMQIAANGQTTVTLAANAGAGLEFSTPGVTAGDGSSEVSSPHGEFSVTGEGQFSRTWTFATHDDADSFIHHVVDKVVAENDLIPDFLQGADDYDLPPQTSDTIYGGVSVEGSASADEASVSGGVEAGLGAEYDADGEKTYFFRAKASAGASFGGGFGADGDGEITLGITYDKDGNEKTMTVQGVGTVSGGLDFSGETGDLSGLMQALEKASVNVSSQAGEQVQFTSTLDLTDPANARAAREFLDGVDPVTGEPVGLGQAASDLYGRFDAAAQTNVRLYDLDTTSAGVDVDASVLGFSVNYTAHDADLTNAWFDPGPGGFQPWIDCTSS